MQFPRTPFIAFAIYILYLFTMGRLVGLYAPLHDAFLLGLVWAVIAWAIVSIPTLIRWLHRRFI